MACTRRRKYSAAIEAFGLALGYDQDSVEALLGRGNALYALERYDEALDTYDRALESAPERPAIHLARANALAELGRSEEAAAAFARAMDLRRRPEQG
jgi:tetratricopeptide (TPR) repeat protein